MSKDGQKKAWSVKEMRDCVDTVSKSVGRRGCKDCPTLCEMITQGADAIEENAKLKAKLAEVTRIAVAQEKNFGRGAKVKYDGERKYDMMHVVEGNFFSKFVKDILAATRNGDADKDGIKNVLRVIAKVKAVRLELLEALCAKDVVCYESTNGDCHDRIIDPEIAVSMILGDVWQYREGWKHCVLRTRAQSEEHEAYVKRCNLEYFEAEAKRLKEELEGAK